MKCLLPFVALLMGCAAEQAGRQAAPRDIECRRAIGPIKIDGVLNEVSWEQAVVFRDFAVSWKNRKPKTATAARLLWDDRFIYFAAEMEDSDLYADETEHNAMIWLNDVFELFFKPSPEARIYYEFQVNAANGQLELFLPSRGSGGYKRFAPVTDFGMESAVKLHGTLNNWQDRDNGWTVEGRIPWTAFASSGGKPKRGAKWAVALCRYDYSEAFENPELSSSAPLTQANFHQYEEYGTLVFRE